MSTSDVTPEEALPEDQTGQWRSRRRTVIFSQDVKMPQILRNCSLRLIDFDDKLLFAAWVLLLGMGEERAEDCFAMGDGSFFVH